MKAKFLLASLLTASMSVSAMAADEVAEGYSFTQLAKHTEGLPASAENRQGILANGAMNILDKSVPQYTVWDATGKIKTVPVDAAVKNTGITADEAGNIIFTDKEFPGAGAPTKLFVYPADGSAMVTIDITGVPDIGRNDFLGKVHGNILEGDAMMILPIKGAASIVVVPFIDGKMDADNVTTIALSKVVPADTSSIAYVIGEDAEGNIEVVYNKRGANNTIAKIVITAGLEGGYELVSEDFIANTPGHNASNGCDVFTMGSKQFIAYPIQTNYRDGFAIAEFTNAETNTEIVKHNEGTTQPNGFQANWVYAQVVDSLNAKIFQYAPGGYIAIYDFKIKSTTPEPPAPTYPEALYVMGNLPGHDWDANCADFVLAQDTVTAGLYKGTATIVAPKDAVAGEEGYFKLTSQTGADWSKYSYAGKNDGDVLALDTPTQIWGGAPNGNSNAFKIKAKEMYEFTVDLRNAEKLTITAKCVTPAPTTPEKLYVIGTIEGHMWDSAFAEAVLEPVAEATGTFKGEVALVAASAEDASAYFKVTGQTGEAWAEHAYAGKTVNQVLALGTATQIWGGYRGLGLVNGNENSFKIEAGKTYELLVDMTNADNMTITATEKVAPVPPVTEPTLTQIAKITEGLPNKADVRQAALSNGKLWLADKNYKKETVIDTVAKDTTVTITDLRNITLWDETGLVKTIDTPRPPVSNTAIAYDEAGNVVMTDKVFPNAGAPTKLFVFPADGSEMVTIDITGVPDLGRMDFLGKIRGNILSGDAMMFLPVGGTASFVVMPFYDGALDADNVSSIVLSKGQPADSGTIVYAIGEDADGNIDVIYNKRGAKNTIVKVVITAGLEGGYELVSETILNTPNHNAANGSDVFTLAGKQYIVYPSQTNYLDGFSIAELTDAVENAEVAVYKETLTKNPNSSQNNWVFAEVVNETTAKLYQYVPGGYIAFYTFQVPEAKPAPVYPEKLYAFGTFNGFTAGEGDYVFTQSTETPGVYNAEFTLTGEEATDFFYLTAAAGGPSVAMSALYSPENDGAELVAGTPMKLVYNSGLQYGIFVKTNTNFAFTVDLRDAENMTITATEKSGVDGVDAEGVKVIGGYGEINIIGNAANIAVYTTNGALISVNETTVNCEAGIYLVVVDGKVTKVLVK